MLAVLVMLRMTTKDSKIFGWNISLLILLLLKIRRLIGKLGGKK